MKATVLKPVTIGDYEIEVSEDNEFDFQNAIDTLMILMRVMGMNITCEQTIKNKYNLISVKSLGEVKTSLSCNLQFYSSPDELRLDAIVSLDFFNIKQIQSELEKEGYSDCIRKRLVGIAIVSNDGRTDKLEKCMISFLTKLQSKT